MEFYQWLVPCLAVFYIVRGYILYKNRKRLIQSTLFWFVFWIMATLLAIIPNKVSTSIANLLGFADNVNAVIFVALGFLFLFVNWLTYVVEKLERQITELVRNIALENENAMNQLSDEEVVEKEIKELTKE